MIRVAINILPLHTSHKHRGIGYYTHNLIEALKKESYLKIQEFIELSEVEKADVIHYPWFDLFFHTLPIRRKFPTVITIHDVIPLIFPKHYPIGIKGRINYFLQKIALKTCKFIITDSETSRKDIIKCLKVEPKKIFPIHLAVDPQFRVLNDAKLLHTKRKYNLPDKFILYVGDAGWSKNLPFLIEGFNKLVKSKENKNLKLILVGGVFLKNVENIDHPELASLRQVEKLIKEYNLEDQILRPGTLENDELVAFYNLATIYVQPSMYEGFGLPILEAQACGTPVISSGESSLKEVGGDVALYFDPANIKQFFTIISEVLQNKSLQEKLAKLGFEQVGKFSWEKTANETAELYRKILKS